MGFLGHGLTSSSLKRNARTTSGDAAWGDFPENVSSQGLFFVAEKSRNALLTFFLGFSLHFIVGVGRPI
jgi:hypothetical protein